MSDKIALLRKDLTTIQLSWIYCEQQQSFLSAETISIQQAVSLCLPVQHCA